MIDFVKKYKPYLIAVLLVTVSLLIARFVCSIDFKSLKNYLSEMPGMFAGVITASLCAYISSTLSWRLCMGNEGKKVPFIELFMYRHVGEMLSFFNPTSIVAGESLKAIILAKKGVSAKHGISSILLQRVLIIFSGLFLGVVTMMYLTLGHILNSRNVLMVIIVSALPLLMAHQVMRFLVHPKLFIGKTMENLKKKTGWPVFSDNLITSAYEMNEASSIFFHENKMKFFLAFLMCIIYWLFGAAEFYIILNMMGMEISIIQASAVEMGVMLFKAAGAIVPGQIGVEEYGNKVMLDVIGIVSNEIWLVVTLIRRGRQLLWLMIAGIFMLIISKTLSPLR
ncbi:MULTISPECIES: lysylphosphatidylglycerol synthase transmembrane domain-containing protein [Proteiniphilum]|mgnify:CR=1 FL=1|jgi:uncharacterized protein (TIRG00374 family)|uniref:lysylphosphatidylglycerol synthase transmembrane domain-containing protein n=1 Tax=Proteiniphilum TaxID=294702 RepID=UPI001EEBEE88|nr:MULTISPECIES: lysylphosphatidylglycerol synthase transmembrane domain-containing protein [Proteiniphilum]ULB34084.1 flippase-like domain-containing protein [Proteiniphilum propionicum]